MATTYRTFPSMALSEAEAKLRKAYDTVGKGPSSKESYVQGLGYKGLSGASTRAIAALSHYGFIEKAGIDYKISSLGMHLLLPDDAEARKNHLAEAALRPSLFKDIFQRYQGERLPAMLNNNLVHDFRVHDKSGKEAADNFRQTLEYAGLIHDGIVGHDEAIEEDAGVVEEPQVPDTVQKQKPADRPQVNQPEIAELSSEMLNKIEIVLRDGVKAGIYAPHNLTAAEKEKLVTIINLL